MASKDSQKEEGLDLISSIVKSVEGVFRNSDVLSLLLGSLFKNNIGSTSPGQDDPRGKTPEEIAKFEKEQRMLEKQPLLVEAIFNGGVRHLIAMGRTTITELDGKPKELLDILRNGRMRGAVMDGTITVKQLSEIAPDKLKEADQLIHGNIDMRYEEGRNNYKKVTELLGLDRKRAESLRASIDKTDQELDLQRLSVGRQMIPNRSGPPAQGR